MEDKNLRPLLEAWAEKLLLTLRANIAKKKLIVSRKLLDSLAYKIEEISEGNFRISISFFGSGRIREMRKVEYNKSIPPIAEIERFVLAQGVSKFKFVPGFKNKIPTTDADAKRIAWGIARSRVLKKSKAIPKAWFSNTLNKSIDGAGGLYEQLYKFYGRFTQLEIIDEFSNLF